jgi:hypothetical protein
MSRLDLQIKELTTKVSLLTTEFSNMDGATNQEKRRAEKELEDLQELLDTLTQIRSEQSAQNEAISQTYNTATNALNRVSELSTKSEKLTASAKTDTETKKNNIKINTYYGKQYEEYKNLFIIITIVCICMIASLLLSYTRFEYVSRPLTIAIGILGGTVIAYRIIGMFLRSNMDYDEYRWVTAPVTDDGIVNANNDGGKIVDVSGISLGSICVGPLCCSEGTEWNSKKGCVLIQPKDITTETD